jgi:hypothetical protein
MELSQALEIYHTSKAPQINSDFQDICEICVHLCP